MSTEHILSVKYARALLQLALEEKTAERVLTDLQLSAEFFGQGEGRQLLVNPLLTQAQKTGAVRKVLEGQVLPLTVTLLCLLIEKRRGGLVSGIARAYAIEWRRLQNQDVAKVFTAVPLDKRQFELLRQRLSGITGKTVDLQQVVDEKMLAGARVELGDRVLDGSLEGRMAQLRRALQEN
jgi:F-type H+-transporting ATPase subunit delta